MCLPQVSYHHGPIIFQGRKNLAKVLELWHRVEGASICLEIIFSALPYLLRCHPVLLLFLPLCALCGVRVEAISDCPRQNNVTAVTPWVGKVDLLQNDHSVPHVMLQEVYADIRPYL